MGLGTLVKPLIGQRVVSQSHTRHLLLVSLSAFGSSSLLPSLPNGPSLLISIWMSQPEGPAVCVRGKQISTKVQDWAGRVLLSYRWSSGEKESRKRARESEPRDIPELGPSSGSPFPSPPAFFCPGDDTVLPVARLLCFWVVGSHPPWQFTACV